MNIQTVRPPLISILLSSLRKQVPFLHIYVRRIPVYKDEVRTNVEEAEIIIVVKEKTEAHLKSFYFCEQKVDLLKLGRNYYLCLVNIILFAF